MLNGSNATSSPGTYHVKPPKLQRHVKYNTRTRNTLRQSVLFSLLALIASRKVVVVIARTDVSGTVSRYNGIRSLVLPAFQRNFLKILQSIFRCPDAMAGSWPPVSLPHFYVVEFSAALHT